MEHDAYAVARQLFGMVLRHARTGAGLSLRELGRRCHYDYSRLSRMETGEHLGDKTLVGVIDQVLDAGGLLTALHAAAQPPTAQTDTTRLQQYPGILHTSNGDQVILEIRTPDGRTVRVSISRRQFGRILATSALPSLLLPGVLDGDDAERVSQTLTRPTRVDRHVVDYFRRVLNEHYTADKMLGPRQILTTVMTQINTLDSLRKHARPPTTTPLLQALARYAEFAGWLHQDAGDIHAAMYWSDRASQWAQATNDQQFVAYMLIRKSNIACMAADPTTAIELAAAAQRIPGAITPKNTALAAQQEARGWAMIDDARRCMPKLDAAATLLSNHPDEMDPAAPIYLHHYNLDTLEEQSASCYRSLGHANRAVTILERRISSLPTHLRRDRGHHMSKLANALTNTTHSDPPRAAELGLECLSIATETGSARIHKELRSLDITLTAKWPDEPHVRTFHEAYVNH